MAVTPLSSVVSVNIVINQAAQSQVDFGLVCLFQTSNYLGGDQKLYTTLSDVLTDFPSNPGNDDDVRNFATAFFGQSPQPQKLLIGYVNTAGAAENYAAKLLVVHQNVPFYFAAFADEGLNEVGSPTGDKPSDIVASINTITAQCMFQIGQTNAIAEAIELKNVNAFRASIQMVDTAQQGVDRIDGALLGSAITQDAGAVNWAYRVLNTVAGSAQSPSALQTFLDARVNVYSNVGGTNVTRFGYNLGTNVGYIDQIQALDYIKTRIEESVFTTLTDLQKVPYTDAGAALLEAKVSNVLNQAAALDIIDVNSIDISTAPVASVSAVDRANRVAPPITFTATLSGAVNKVIVNGVLEV